MSDQEAFERILASLYDAMLDDTHWPATSALIDEACDLTGNGILVGEGPKDDIRVLSVGLYHHGQRREDLEREYLEVYHPIDERVPQVRQLPDSRLVQTIALYTAEELKTSPTYNEMLPRAKHQDSLLVRLDGSDGSYMTWCLGDPVDSEGWGSSRIKMVTRPAAPYPTIYPCPAGAGPRQGTVHDRDRPARQPSDRCSSPGPARGGSWRPMTTPVASCGTRRWVV